jgi:hypothetical protein
MLSGLLWSQSVGSEGAVADSKARGPHLALHSLGSDSPGGAWRGRSR